MCDGKKIIPERKVGLIWDMSKEDFQKHVDLIRGSAHIGILGWLDYFMRRVLRLNLETISQFRSRRIKEKAATFNKLF